MDDANNQTDKLPNTSENSEKTNLETKSKMEEKSNKKGPEIVPFSPEAGMNWQAWLQYFDSICIENNLDDVWKIRNIQKYLKESALTVYINNCLHILHWSELTELFTENYSLPGELTLADFSEIKFKTGDNLNEYYQKKIKMGRELGLDQKFILQGLTEGLTVDLKRLVITNTPKTAPEWRELVFKLVKLTPSSKIENKSKEEPIPQVRYPYRPWQNQQPNQGNNLNVYARPWSYRVPFQPTQSRPFVPNQDRNPRYIRPSYNQSARPQIHYQNTLPPNPCRICLNIGIPNAYHWARDCPFKMQILNPNQVRNMASQKFNATNSNPNGTVDESIINESTESGSA